MVGIYAGIQEFGFPIGSCLRFRAWYLLCLLLNTHATSNGSSQHDMTVKMDNKALLYDGFV